MAVNDEIYSNLSVHGGSTINERVYNYLGSLGYTGTLSDRLARYEYEGSKGWKGLTREFPPKRDFPSWTPATLFADGQQGVWYLSQPTYQGQQILWQDEAMTIPAAAHGDPVRVRMDVSPNGLHAIAVSDAARAMYGTDGTRHWLESDGVNTRYRVQQPSRILATDGSLFMSFATQKADVSRRETLAGRYKTVDNKRSWFLEVNNGSAQLWLSPDGSANDSQSFTLPVGDNAAFVITFRKTPTNNFWRVNGQVRTDPPLYAALNDPVDVPIGWFRSEHADRVWTGRCYGGVIRSGAATAEEGENLHAYHAVAAGVTLP